MDGLEASKVLERYESLWPGRVPERKQELFVRRIRDFPAAIVLEVLDALAVWREAATRPTIGAVVERVGERLSREKAERQPGEEPQGEPITAREYLRRVLAGEHSTGLEPEEERKAIGYLAGALGINLESLGVQLPAEDRFRARLSGSPLPPLLLEEPDDG